MCCPLSCSVHYVLPGFLLQTVYPGTLPTKASALIDWRQLVVTVAMLLDKKNVAGIMAQTSAVDTPSPEKVGTCMASSQLHACTTHFGNRQAFIANMLLLLCLSPQVKALCNTRCQRPENKDLQDVMCMLYRRAQWEEVEPGKQ